MDFPAAISVPALPGCAMEFLNMSMPSFPPNGANMTREEALTMIIACIAMEELALSHILNAGGENLQFILGTLPGTSSQDVLAIHKSITALVDAVTQNQILLKKKLDQVLEFCPIPPPSTPPPPPPPPPPPGPEPAPPSYPSEPGVPPWPLPYPTPPYGTPPCEKSVLQLAGQQERMQWKPDCRLSWRKRRLSGRDIRWDGCTPARIQLNPRRTYMVQYTLRHVPGRGNGYNSSQAVALQYVCRCAAPVFFLGKPDAWPPDPAACLCTASPHKQRVCDGAVPGVECKNPAVRGVGRNGYCSDLTKNQKALIYQGFLAN